MTLGTHVAFASVLYLGGATLFGYKPDGISWTLAAVASLLPDVDLPPARIGRLFWFVSVPLERRFGHHTLTHSALMLLAVALLAAPLWFLNLLYFWAVVGGYWSHLWLDMLNIRGIDLFWPSPLRVVAERVDLRGHTLHWLVSRIDQSRPYFLLGEVEIAEGWGPALTGRLDSMDTYNPASYRDGILRLHYARAAELGPWLDLVAVRGELVVQVWLKPGEAAALGPGEEREVERIPA